MKSKATIGILLLLMVSGARAQSNEELEKQLEVEEGAPSQQVSTVGDGQDKLVLQGYILGKSGVSTTKNTTSNVIGDSQVKVQLGLDGKIGNASSGHAAIDFYYDDLQREKQPPVFATDTASQRSYEEIYQLREDRFYTRIREAYVDVYGSFVELRVGRQIIKWGAADSPTARMNPNSMVSTPEMESAFLQQAEDLLLGVNAIKNNWFFLGMDLELILIPVYQPARLTDPSTYWGLPLQQRPIVVNGSNIPVTANSISNDYPETTIKNMEGGARLGFNLLDSDMNFYYFHGREDLPELRQDLLFSGAFVGTDFVPTTVKIESEAVYPEFNGVGYSARGSFKSIKLGYRADVNAVLNRYYLVDTYTSDAPDIATSTLRSRQQSVEKHEVTYNLGLQYNVPLHNLTANIDYYEKRILQPNASIIARSRQSFLAPRLEDHFMRQTLFLKAHAIWDVDTNHVFVRPEIEYRPSETSQLFLGMLIFTGDEEQIESARDLNMGAYTHHDFVYFWARYSF